MQIEKLTELWDNTAKKALKQRVRRQCPEHYAEIDLQVRKLLQKNFIVECNEEYYSQVLLVRKSDLSWRFCIDYRYLNKVTEGCSWPIPDIKVLLTLVSGKAFYAVMDCTQGYHQVELTREASRLTAFITGSGMFRWNRLPFGLKGAPSYFQFHMQNSVFAGLIGVCCFVYIDDIIVFGATWVEYLKNLELVLNRLRDWDVKLKLSKCKFGLESAKFLGHVVSKHGVQMDDARKDQIVKMVQPQTVTQLRSFLGMTNYFHDFVEHYANLSYSLYGLLKGNTLKNDLIKWTDDSERAFRKLQKAIVDAPMLFTIQAEGKLTLYTDASSYAAGGHLTQFIQGKECTIAFVSKVFSEVQRRWPTCDQEMFAVYFSIKKLHYLIGGRKFYVKTDHKNLQYWSHTSASPKIERWKVFLSEYDFVMEYIKGEDNCVADALS